MIKPFKLLPRSEPILIRWPLIPFLNPNSRRYEECSNLCRLLIHHFSHNQDTSHTGLLPISIQYNKHRLTNRLQPVLLLGLFTHFTSHLNQPGCRGRRTIPRRPYYLCTPVSGGCTIRTTPEWSTPGLPMRTAFLILGVRHHTRMRWLAVHHSRPWT